MTKVWFTNSRSRLIWYGNPPADTASSRVLIRSDRLPEWRISQFSPMSILFSPENETYGPAGVVVICANGQTSNSPQQCQDRRSLWYSDWGYQEEGKIHICLTFNPYFDWQTQIMNEVLAEG
ncbi:hypothetical protein [Brenneria salicis]|uniref:Uncharacterized protein n=1 Tax=Brenneria salicis ATCC 15712 = DSM 30166 TaxID=714314 RepID=A0A366IBW0_9GAMM|nr:hypothetical protein [Brenneria salicis]RBP67750.1 hypothetical protein DES54_101272 [Brenneria salicis ATCC 15712 = DSM 30166]RLM32284.1 hypothetical protein BHG07_00165 [Brenneria salicis ATCC 15712 = DSM 30166]